MERKADAVMSVRMTDSPAATMPNTEPKSTVPAARESSSKLQPVMSMAALLRFVNSMNSPYWLFSAPAWPPWYIHSVMRMVSACAVPTDRDATTAVANTADRNLAFDRLTN